MKEKLYSKEHEWIRLDESDNAYATVGITNHAQESLGDIVYVDLPSIGDKFDKDVEIAVIESAKAASDIYAPISGEVCLINSALLESPNIINESPDKEGWLFKLKISDVSELDTLLTESQYQEYIG